MSATSAFPQQPLGVQGIHMHPSSEPATDSARNDYAPRSYPCPSTADPIGYSQAQAMLSAAYANYGVSQAQSQAFPLVVQNDGAALELAHHDYQSQLAGHINAYNLATAAVPGDQLLSFHQHQPSAASMALQQYTDATGYQFQPPNPQAPSSVTENILAPHIPATLPSHPQPTRSTLHFSNLEPWMDVDYFNKLAGMMNWQNVILKIPTTPSNEGVGSFGKSGSLVPNNPGCCFITFPTPASAAAVLKSLTEGDQPKVMPNSKRPFVVTWATVPASSARTNAQRADSFGYDLGASGLFAPGNLSLLNLHTPPAADDPTSQPNRQQEFSIFVGDLAPETTNSDLIAVFRDPILGLRHDREPKFVAPFLSCKSAKIMVDPVMGVSKGYGFVRFGTPTDASRALIEMQGLYCLSRPSGFDSALFTVASTLTRHSLEVRISQATAKARTHGYVAQTAAAVPSHGTPPPHPFTPPFDHDFHSNGSDRGTGSTVTSPSAAHPVNAAAHAFIVGHQKEATSPTGSTSSAHSLQEAQRAASRRGEVGPESDPLDSLPSETLNALSTLNIDRNTLSQLLKMAMVKPSAEQEENEVNRVSSDPLSAPATIRHFGQSDGLPHRASTIGSGQGHVPSRSYPQSMNGASPQSPATLRGMVPPSNGVDSLQTSQAKALVASVMGNNASALNSSDPYNTT
ncbi:RRM protein, partial [Tulasnella sp. UAMH 9824]